MEYLEHGDLHNFLLASEPLHEDIAGEIAFQVLEGLSFMHENSFAHRDLKPAVCPRYWIGLSIARIPTNAFRIF
jgi:serine/threonine protein kinase